MRASLLVYTKASHKQTTEDKAEAKVKVKGDNTELKPTPKPKCEAQSKPKPIPFEVKYMSPKMMFNSLAGLRLVIIDVRPEEEYQKNGHILRAISFPVTMEDTKTLKTFAQVCDGVFCVISLYFNLCFCFVFCCLFM